ncbi:MAG TPA: hypothetical protein VGU23_10965 [Acidobacteriaceae bacterium]|nr:hypothetical protein [Acidobacteriaceae bacterium]
MPKPKLNWVKEDINPTPRSVPVYHTLLIASVLLFLPYIFWRNQHLLEIAIVVVWISFLYSSLLMIFGESSTVLRLWFSNRWRRGPDPQLLFQARILGMIGLAFTLIVPFQIVHSVIAHPAPREVVHAK